MGALFFRRRPLKYSVLLAVIFLCILLPLASAYMACDLCFASLLDHCGFFGCLFEKRYARRIEVDLDALFCQCLKFVCKLYYLHMDVVCTDRHKDFLRFFLGQCREFILFGAALGALFRSFGTFVDVTAY